MTPRNSKQTAEIIARQTLAMDLRKAGFSYREIGKKLNISHEQARRDVEGVLKELITQRNGKFEHERELDLQRLEMMIKGLEPMASIGKPDAVTALLRCLVRRAALLGLDEPKKSDFTSGGQPLTGLVINIPDTDD